MADGSGILDPTLLSYAAFPSTAGLSYPELQRRRAIAQALASQKRGFPKNIGEGLTSLGEAIGDRMTDARLAAAEQSYVGDRATNPLFRQPGAPAPGATLGGLGGAAANPTLAAGDTSPQATLASGDPSGGDDPRLTAIGGIETGGQKDPYRTVGVPTKYGPALGKYGIVAANVPKWTAAALGQPLTPQQFLADDKAQDITAKHRMDLYTAKYGDEGAGRAWFGGPGNVNNPGVTDAHGRLTVGTYGQDYLRRLQGAKRSGAIYPSGSMTGAAPGVADSAPVLADENPATPTDIAAAPAPMLVASGASDGGDAGGSTTIDTATGAEPSIRMAQARGVPAPGDQPTAVPGLTPEQLQRRPGFDISSTPPAAPRKQETLTPEESRGWQILNHPRFAGDPQATEIAKNLIKFGSDRREADYNRQVEEYKLKYGTHEKEAARRAEAESPLKQAELRTKLGDEEKRRRLGGIPEESWQKGLEESRKNIESVPAASMALKAAREDLVQGKMFTGTDAEFQLAKAKAKAALGWDPDPRIRATEAFKAEVAPVIAAARTALAGNANISDADMKAATRAAAGDITLDAESIKRVFNLIERINTEKVIAHNRQVRTYAGNDEDAQRGAYGRYGVDMTKVVPDWAIKRLREDQADPSAHKEFDDKYHWPGLSKIILDSGR